MTRERIDRAASGRFTPMIHDLARVLGNDPVTALVYQTLFFRSGIEADRDGWLDMSEVRMASELSCTRYAAHEALTKLEEEYELCRVPGGLRQPA